MYYTIIIMATVVFMDLQMIQLAENETLRRKEKTFLAAIAVTVTIGASCEFFGYYLNEKSMDTIVLHGIVKFIEFSIVPCIPILYCLAVDFEQRSKLRRNIIAGILSINVLFELISIFTPFIFYINDKNVYVRGQFYWIYVMYYLCGIAYFIYVLMKAISKYQNKNILSLIGIVTFFMISMVVRAYNSDIRTDWLFMAMAYSSFINYYSDMSLKVDVLTSLLNRRSYEHHLQKVDYPTCVIQLDINNFKTINDTYGHHCGDICLRVVAETILENYKKVAYCYRTGGDEFTIIFKRGEMDIITQKNEKHDLYAAINALNENFTNLLETKYDSYPMLKSGVSYGFGVFYGTINSAIEVMQDSNNTRFSDGTLTDALRKADERMYEMKQRKK